MRNIRASEIGAFLYCQRAWWYWRQGYEPGNQAEMNAGMEFHIHHAKLSLLSSVLRFLAVGLLVLALVLGVLSIAGLIG